MIGVFQQNIMKMKFIFLLALLIHSALSVSLDNDSLWHVFTELPFKDMKSFVAAHPHLLHDQNVRALVQCRGIHLCAFHRKPNGLILNALPHRLDKHLIRQAALGNDKQAVENLIKLGVDAKWLDYPLKRALRLNLNDQAEWMRSLLPPSLKRITVIKANPEIDPENFMEACKRGSENSVDQMIQQGVDVNAKDSEERTALMFAATHGHFKVAKRLLEEGADILAKSDIEYTALSMAVWHGHVEILKLLIMAGGDVNSRDISDSTAIMKASISGNSAILKTLIEAGADVNAKDFVWQTALMYAVTYGHVSETRLLIEAGADVNSKEKFGHTVLMKAVEKGSVEIVKDLVEAGVEVNAKNRWGETALDFAPMFSRLRAVLKRAGAKSGRPSIWQRFTSKSRNSNGPINQADL